MAKNKKKLNIVFILGAICLIAFILRTAWFPTNLFFGWEQGRDFLKMAEIVSGDQTLVGPKTDIPGVFHGALSYYIPLVPYLLFKGNPYLVLTSYIVVHSASIVVLYLFARDMFSKKVGLLTSLFYAVSYSAIIYARWLSNPNLVPALTIFFVYCIYSAKKDWRYLLLAALFWSIIVHLIVVIAIALIPPTLYFLWKEKVKVTLPRIVPLGGIIGIMLSSYALFEYKNNFIMIKSFLGDHRSQGNFLTSSLGLVDQFINEIVDSITPLYPRIGFLVFLVVLFFAIRITNKVKETTYILWYLFATAFIFFFLSNAPLRHFFIIVPIFWSVLLAVVVDQFISTKQKRLGYFLVALVLFGNLSAVMKRLPESEANFIHHAQRTYLSNMIELIDYAYLDAAGEPFTYDYYSMPYWKEDAWIYLFSWYGKNTYGYAPQADRTNVDRSDIFYTFIEPNETVPIHQNNWYGEYKKDLELLDTYQSGKLKVEKRREKMKHDVEKE